MESILNKYMTKEPDSSVDFFDQTRKSFLGPAAKEAFFQLLHSTHFGGDAIFLSLDNLVDALLLDANNFSAHNDFEKAEKSLTTALSAVKDVQAIYFDLRRKQYANIFLKRSSVRAERNKTCGAVSDAAHSIFFNSDSVDAHFQLSKCLSQYGKRAHSVQVLFYALANHGIDRQWHFVKLIVNIAIGVSKLSVEEVDLHPIPPEIIWLRDVPTWQKIIKELAVAKEYNALGVITTGTCTNLRSIVCSSNVIFKAANIPGVTYKCVNIGSMLKAVWPEEIHRWHLQMAEFMIKKGADVTTIGKAFDQPLLVAMVTLSMHTDVPSFVHLGFPHVCVTNLDEQDKDGRTPFHAVLSQTDKHRSKTVDILCRALLAEGCITSLRDNQGKMAHEYLPPNMTLWKSLSQAALFSWDGLFQRVKTIKNLAKEKLDANKIDQAIEIYQKGLSICQRFQDMRDRTLIFLTNLSIANDKKGNYNQSLKYAEESVMINHSYWKGHYWVGNSQYKLGDAVSAAEAFGVCYDVANSEGVKISVLMKALELLPRLRDSPIFDGWLYILGQPDVWPIALEKMTSSKLWTSLQLLLLGPPFSEKGQGIFWDKSAAGAKLKFIFDVIHHSDIHADRLILALLQHGADIKTISPNSDNVLHEVVRFCALTNDTAVLKHVLLRMKESGLKLAQNAEGKTPLHQLGYLTGGRMKMEIKVKLAQILCEAGLDVNVKDVDGKTAADYAPVDSALRNYLKDGKASKLKDTGKEPAKESKTWQELKEQGNQLYKAEKYSDAASLYSNALRKSADSTKVTNHDRAVLYSNRSECFFKMKCDNEALEDAQKCVALDAQWFKGHRRVAKVLARLEMVNQATEAFINCYNRIEESGYSIRISVLSELMDCLVSNQKPKEYIAYIFGQTIKDCDVMLELAVNYLKEDKWPLAKISFIALVPMGKPAKKHSMDLKSFCKTNFLCDCGHWMTPLLFMALQANDSVTSLKFHLEDTYFHAFVNIYLQIRSGPDSFFDQFLHEFVSDKNIRDGKGNTVLHFLAENRSNSQICLQMAQVLIGFGVDMRAINKEGKKAQDLCGRGDNLLQLFQYFFTTGKGLAATTFQFW